MMQAVVLHANKSMQLETLTIPPLASDECRIRVRAVGVCSSDIARSHEQGAYFYPLIMGHELAGEIVAVGEDVAYPFHVGDRVAVYPLIPCGQCASCASGSFVHCTQYDYYGSRRHGGFAEYLNVRAWNLLPLPEAVSFEQAAALEPLSVCVHALNQAGLGAGDRLATDNTVAIVGAGFLGLLTAKLLAWWHPTLRVTLLDRNQFKLDKNQHATHEGCCLLTPDDWQGFLGTRAASSFSHVIESCGVPDTFRYTLSLARPKGCVVWMGNSAGDVVLPKTLVSSILRKELTIKGTWNSDYAPLQDNDWTQARDLLAQGFSLGDLITERISLCDLPSRLAHLHAHKTRAAAHPILKILVTP